MIKANPQGECPQIHESAFIDDTAVIIGKVVIEKDVFVGPCAVLRADEPGSSIVIRANCNVQDGVIIHTFENSSVEVDESASLSHGCIVHGPCRIGKRCFVGFGSVILGAEIGEGAIIMHLAIAEKVRITPHRVVESRQLVRSEDQVLMLRHVDKNLQDFAGKVVEANVKLLKGYRDEKGGISGQGRHHK